MASSSSPSIEHLPVEIFHRIFDHLDAQTILYSVRPVCRSFRSIVNSYDRYKFDFKIISKCNFHRLCRLIPPQHLISLTLYNDEQIPDQISFFTLNYRLRQLTRLRSISLLGIDECQLNLILKRINLDHLTSFSLYIREYDDRRRKTTVQDLSSIMAQPNLRKVELNIRNYRLSDIQWPLNSSIESLTINADITMDNLFQIIGCSPQLHTLIIKNEFVIIPDNVNQKSVFPQITSLTLGNFNMSIDYLELFLSLIPSLTYLKLISRSCVFDGKRCEEFIEANLPHLNKFEFSLTCRKSIDQTQDDLQLILQSFQSPFWIEHKKWFVACAFRFNAPRTIQIYSIPICKSIFNYELDSEIYFLSTSTYFLNLEKINEIDLELEHLINNDLLKTMNRPFPNVTKLRLQLCENNLPDSINRLQSIVNISQLIEVHLDSSGFDNYNKDLLFAAIKLIEQSPKLTYLTIHGRPWKVATCPFLNDLCSIIPRQIKYLQIPITQLEQIEIIFERCQYLLVVKLETNRKNWSIDITEWIDHNRIHSILRRQNGFSHVWIGEKIKHINENLKGIKLIENESN